MGLFYERGRAQITRHRQNLLGAVNAWRVLMMQRKRAAVGELVIHNGLIVNEDGRACRPMSDIRGEKNVEIGPRLGGPRQARAEDPMLRTCCCCRHR